MMIDFEIISQILSIVALLVVLVNIITEVVKKVCNIKDAKYINIFVVILSLILTYCSFFAYWQIKGLTMTWYLLVSFTVVGFMVSYGAMFGYDKLISYFKELEGK